MAPVAADPWQTRRCTPRVASGTGAFALVGACLANDTQWGGVRRGGQVGEAGDAYPCQREWTGVPESPVVRLTTQAGYALTRQERAHGVPDRTVNRGESGSLTGTPQVR